MIKTAKEIQDKVDHLTLDDLEFFEGEPHFTDVQGWRDALAWVLGIDA